MNGRRALLALLQHTQGRFVAARCRVSPSCVSEWAAGLKRPSARARTALESNYGISSKSWGSTDTKNRCPPRLGPRRIAACDFLPVGLRDRLTALFGVTAYQAPPANGAPSLDSEEVEAIRRILGGQISPAPTTQTRWYLSDLEAAQHSADTGNIAAAARLMRAARTDGILTGVLSTRTAGLVSLPKRFRGDPEIRAALELGHEDESGEVRSVFDEMFPPAELAAMAADGILLGVAVGELVPIVDRDYPRLVRLDPENLRYRWSENRWYFRSVAGEIPVTPGDGRWVLHVAGGAQAPWQHGLWKAIGRAFIRKEHAGLYKDSWEAKLANPARVAVSPQGSSEEHAQAWFQAVLAWGVNTVLGMKPGYDVKLVESNGRGWESFVKTIEMCDGEYIICIAGQKVTTDGGAGFQNSDIHKSIRADLIQSTADGLAYTINTQGIPVFVYQRFGEARLAKSPVMWWDVTPPKDRAQEAQSLVTTAQAIDQLTTALATYGRKLDVDALCSRFGIPVAGDRDGDGKPDDGETKEVRPALRLVDGGPGDDDEDDDQVEEAA